MKKKGTYSENILNHYSNICNFKNALSLKLYLNGIPVAVEAPLLLKKFVRRHAVNRGKTIRPPNPSLPVGLQHLGNRGPAWLHEPAALPWCAGQEGPCRRGRGDDELGTAGAAAGVTPFPPPPR